MLDNFDVVLTGDNHEGNSQTAHEQYGHMVDKVASEKNTFMVHMGDACESRCTDHKYFSDETCEIPIPMRQADNMIEIHKPIAKKILVWMRGNHEWDLHRFGDLSEYIAKGIECPYGTYTSRLQFQSKRGPMFRAFFTHGIGCQLISNAKDHEQRVANMKATLKSRLQNKSGDCALMACGDTHKLLIVDPAPRLFLSGDESGVLKSQYLKPDGGMGEWIEPDRRWYVNTGSWLKLYTEGVSGYAERFGCDPIELGYAIAEIRDRKLVNVRKVVI
jgi:hypothetical protein